MTDATATFGGGCFWCMDAVFRRVHGVRDVTSGYAGGAVKDPTYEEVCEGETGHAEVVRVRFDPDVVSFDDLLEIFLTTHDPTTPNRQGADEGPQYRSIILYEDEAQRHAAEGKILEWNRERVFPSPIVTEVRPFTQFFPAEGYHQDFFARNPYQPYCRAVIAPKVAKLRAKWQAKLAPGA